MSEQSPRDGGSEPVEVEPDWPYEPYTLRRFLRELAIAVAILAVGLPLVLLATRGSGQDAVSSAVVPSARQPVATAPAATSAAERPVLVVAGPALVTDAVDVPGLLDRDGSALTGAGAGFAVGSPSLTSLVAEAEIDPEQALVVVQGGEADVALTPERVDLAVQQLADRIRGKVSPSTAIAFVGPVPLDPEAPEPGLLRVRDAARAAAAAKQVHFVDPVELGWSLRDRDLAQKAADAVAGFLVP